MDASLPTDSLLHDLRYKQKSKATEHAMDGSDDDIDNVYATDWKDTQDKRNDDATNKQLRDHNQQLRDELRSNAKEHDRLLKEVVGEVTTQNELLDRENSLEANAAQQVLEAKKDSGGS